MCCFLFNKYCFFIRFLFFTQFLMRASRTKNDRLLCEKKEMNVNKQTNKKANALSKWQMINKILDGFICNFGKFPMMQIA